MSGTYQGGSLVFGAPLVHTVVLPDEIGAVEIRDANTDARARVLNILGTERLAVDATMGGAPIPIPVPVDVVTDPVPVDIVTDPVPVEITASLPLTVGMNAQLFTAQTTTPLGPSGTFGGTAVDLQYYAGYGISVFITRDTVDTNVDVIVEESADNLTWREVETINLAVTAAAPSNGLQRVYSPIRRYMRTRLVNKTANALSVTELYCAVKPIP